ncbi:MAG: hypothetical protein AAFP90_15615, partial [Planctomycetota bacterium]
TMTAGPGYYNPSTKTMKTIGSNNSRLTINRECEVNQRCGPAIRKSSSNITYRQLTLSWYGTHSGGNAVNMLFADGSVKQFYDSNGDNYFNPGFPVPDDLTEEEYLSTGYTDGVVELPPFEFYSGVFLAPNTIKMALED